MVLNYLPILQISRFSGAN